MCKAAKRWWRTRRRLRRGEEEEEEECVLDPRYTTAAWGIAGMTPKGFQPLRRRRPLTLRYLAWSLGLCCGLLSAQCSVVRAHKIWACFRNSPRLKPFVLKQTPPPCYRCTAKQKTLLRLFTFMNIVKDGTPRRQGPSWNKAVVRCPM